MPEEISDEKIIKRLEMEKNYYQNSDPEDAIDTVTLEIKAKKERVRELAKKVYEDYKGKTEAAE